jgi:hypothetical protein
MIALRVLWDLHHKMKSPVRVYRPNRVPSTRFISKTDLTANWLHPKERENSDSTVSYAKIECVWWIQTP